MSANDDKLASLPAKNSEYGTKEYWDSRYQHEANVDPSASFDWFKSYDEIATLMRPLIPDKNARILMLGCGNSKLSEQMWDDGYKNIVNIDYSSVVIDQMKKLHENSRPELEWQVMDIRELDFPDDSFDVAIDKGTMDAMMAASESVWDPPQQVIDDCTREIDEVLRVLRRKSGIFLYLTFGQPHFRRRFLQRQDTTLEVKTLGDAFHYYLYVVKT